MKKLVLILLSTLSLNLKAEVLDRIVAIVNNEIITESDVSEFSSKLGSNSFIDDLLLFGKTAADLKKDRSQQLQYLIHERLMSTEVKRLNLSITIERVEQEIREVAKKNGMSRTELLAAVKNQGISTSQYQDFVKTRIERQSLIESEITSRIRVSDEDLLAQYAKQFGQEAAIFEFTLAHILFNPKKGGLQAAKERAEEALKKLRSGGDFDTLAEQYSEDADFTTGGLLGSFKAGEFSSELEAAVSKLQAGDISSVVKTKAGFHILRLINKKVVSDPRFEKEKEKIKNVLFEQTFQKNFRSWLESKKEDSFIRINKT